MAKINVDEEHKKALDNIMQTVPGVRPGKMFGYPAYYVGRKMFTSFYEDGVCAKVPLELKERLIEDENIEPFIAMGRHIKKWVLIKVTSAVDYQKYADIFKTSAEYVDELVKKK